MESAFAICPFKQTLIPRNNRDYFKKWTTAFYEAEDLQSTHMSSYFLGIIENFNQQETWLKFFIFMILYFYSPTKEIVVKTMPELLDAFSAASLDVELNEAMEELAGGIEACTSRLSTLETWPFSLKCWLEKLYLRRDLRRLAQLGALASFEKTRRMAIAAGQYHSCR